MSGLLSEYSFAVLNTGMESDQIAYLKDNNVLIKDAIWNVNVPNYKILGRDHLKTQVARAFCQIIFLITKYIYG